MEDRKDQPRETSILHPPSSILASLLRSILYSLSSILVFLSLNCINKPQNPAATQPATAIDPATTQPSYWLNQPAAAHVQTTDFDQTWNACKSVARGYLYTLDREDYRDGLITTAPMISKQWFEPWRPDTGTVGAMLANSTSAFRRTLRFEIDRNPDNTFTVTPKVLVEREALLERRVTDVSQYRLAFAGAALRQSPRYSNTFDSGVNPDIVPFKYYYPVARDTEMEKQVAQRLRSTLDKSAPAPIATIDPKTPVTPAPASGQPADGAVAAIGLTDTVYINLGAADKVVPGMTFAVFDKKAIIPALDQFAAENPGLKGWIEILTVANTSSTAKVIKSIAPITQGDNLYNFIYQRGQQNHFGVAGEFQTATRDTLSGLVWRWNGVVDDQVTGNTTCIILGQPPKDAPSLKIYEALRARAAELKIPIIDETRFNLLIRYYDPAKR